MNKEELLALGLSEETATKIIEDQTKNFIPKYRFDEVNTEKKNLETTVNKMTNQLEELSNSEKTIEELKKDITDLQVKNKEQKDKYDLELNKLCKDNAITIFLNSQKVKNIGAVKKLLDSDSIEFKNDKLVGIEEQVKSLKEDETLKSLFEEIKVGNEPKDGKDKSTSKGLFDEVIKSHEENNDNKFNPWEL